MHKKDINQDSLKVIDNCYAEPFINEISKGEQLQFLRHGYFCKDKDTTNSGAPVFNRTAPLRDSWAKKKN